MSEGTTPVSMDHIVIRASKLGPTVGVNLLIPLTLKGSHTRAVVDTAAQITMISLSFWRGCHGSAEHDGEPLRVSNAEASSYMECHLVRNVIFRIGHIDYKHDVAVGPINDDFIIGLDFLIVVNAGIDLQQCNVTLGDQLIPAEMLRGMNGQAHHVATICVSGNHTLQPHSSHLVRVTLSSTEKVLFASSPMSTPTVAAAACLFEGGQSQHLMEVTNDTSHSVLLEDRKILGCATEANLADEGPVIRQSCACQDDVLTAEQELSNRNRLKPLISDTPFPEGSSAINNATIKLESSLPEAMSDLYRKGSEQLNPSERLQLLRVLNEYADCFAKGKEDLGRFSLLKHRIVTTDEAPVQERMRRTPTKFVNEEESTLKSMLEAGVIRPSSSSWASALVLVRKKDGEVRYTVDYRKVNAKTVKDVYPLPLIGECIDALEGTLDLASGYWQIDIDPRDSHKTAFFTRHGLFEHVRLAQGLCNAPATFQRVMHLVLRGLTWGRALVYLDDIIILGQDSTSPYGTWKWSYSASWPTT